MRLRLGTLLFVVLLGAALLAATVMAAGNAADLLNAQDEESAREEAAAAADLAASNQDAGRSRTLVATATMTAPLFAGVNDFELFTHAIDPETGVATPLFDGFEIWGAAYDRQNEIVYMAEGARLIAWPIGDAPTVLGTMYASSTTTTSVNFVGLAFHNGTLYGTRNISGPNAPEAAYTIDTTTLEATLAFTYSIGVNAANIGGLAAHPFTGVLYGANDDSDFRGLVQLDRDGTISLVAPYPDGQEDIDGLAIGSDNRAYLVTGDPGFFYVFDFDTMTYTAPITNPWSTTNLFAGGAWVTDPITPGLTLTKTVGLDANACAPTGELAVLSGTLVTYCYEVTNTGNVELNIHDLQDSELGDILSGFAFQLEPAASVFLTQTAAITQATVNTATWTAYNTGPLDVISATATAEVTILEPAIALSKTVGLDPNECATGSELTVGAGTDVTYCYRVTNTGDVTLTRHSLVDTQLGEIFTDTAVALSPTATFFVTETVQISETVVNTATWTAYNDTPGDGAAATAVAAVTVGLPDPPAIAVTPLELTATITEGSVITAALTISNSGDLPLTWTITEATPTCATPAGLAWVESDPPAGTTAPGGSSEVTVTFGAPGMPVADYAGALCVGSNDPDAPLTEVGLSLTIVEPPRFILYVPANLGSPQETTAR